MTVKKRIRHLDISPLYKGWANLKRATYEYLRSDGVWQTQTREIFDCGHGAAILLYDLQRRTVILTRQFRFAAFSHGYDGLMIEVPAGLLDDASPEDRVRAETEEETGYRVREVRKVIEAYISPGAVTQMNYGFVGAYKPQDRVSEGGGRIEEGEDIEVLELDFDEAMAMIEDGRIQDGKTIILLQYAALHLFAS
jgi:nudix-type nucleoside diphosphatase (YffH/AdpP family)